MCRGQICISPQRPTPLRISSRVGEGYLFQFLFLFVGCVRSDRFSRGRFFFASRVVSAFLFTFSLVGIRKRFCQLVFERFTCWSRIGRVLDDSSYDSQYSGNTRFFIRLAHSCLFFVSQQLHHPEGEQRPIQFDGGILWCPAAKFRSSKRLFETTELNLTLPTIMPPLSQVLGHC